MLHKHHLFQRGWIPICFVAILCLSSAGCSRDSWLNFLGYDRASLLKKQLPHDDEVLARHGVDLLLQNRFDEIEDQLDPSIRNGDTREHLAAMSSLFPSAPISVKAVDARVIRDRDSSSTSITLEYEFAQSWLLAEVVIRTKDRIKTIAGFHVSPTAEPLEVMNEFTFTDKGFSQYAGLFLALWVAVLTVYAFVLCVRAKITNKWFWVLAILTGVCRLTVNWTTGQWFFTPFSVRIASINLSCSAYGPWMLQIYSPVGAIAFLQLRKRLVSEALPISIVPKAESEEETPAQPAPATTARQEQ